MSNNLGSEVTRRQFMQDAGQGLAAASLAGGVLSAASGQTASTPTSGKLGWAIVGLGNYAMNQIMPRFEKCEHSKLVALVSGSPDKAQREAQKYGVEARNIYNYQNFDEIKNNPDVHIVYIILPNSMHHEYVIRAAQAGKHVVTEKPMAVSVRECEEMIAACRRANRKLMVGYRSRFEPHNIEAIRMAREQVVGQTKVITSESGFNIGDPNQWRLDRERSGGGSLMDIGIYSVQAARYLSGEEPVEVNAVEYTDRKDPRFREVEDTINFQFRFPSGTLANCVSAYSSGHNRYRVVGAKGWFELEPATSYSGQKMRVKTGRNIEEKQLPTSAEVQFPRQLDHMSECVMQNKEPLVPGEEGLRDVRIMMAIYEAARTGKTIKLS